MQELKGVEFCYIQRSHFTKDRLPETIELHIFSDASEKAYSTAAYFGGIYNDGATEISFVAGKVTVVPLKPLSIPQMELQGALIACRLRNTILQEYELKMTKKIYWTDSRTVLGWIRTDPVKYQTLVANRLEEIDEL